MRSLPFGLVPMEATIGSYQHAKIVIVSFKHMLSVRLVRAEARCHP